MIVIQWSNGSRQSAPTWEALTAAVAAVQWHEYDSDQIKHVLAKRAWRWSGMTIDPYADDREFWHQAQKAKLVIIEKEGEQP